MSGQAGRRGRILVAKVGLDGHDRGAKVLSRALRDQGFEVIYLGVRNSALQVAAVALEEWVDVVAISLLSGAHLEAAAQLRPALDRQGLRHVQLVMGGLIPADDASALAALGVAKSFHPGDGVAADPARLAQAIDRLVAQARQADRERP